MLGSVWNSDQIAETGRYHVSTASNEVPFRTKSKSERSFSELVRRMERVRNCFGNAVRPQTLLECANSLGTRLTTFWNTWCGAKLLCCLLHFEVPRGSTKMSEVVSSRVVSQRVAAIFCLRMC